MPALCLRLQARRRIWNDDAGVSQSDELRDPPRPHRRTPLGAANAVPPHDDIARGAQGGRRVDGIDAPLRFDRERHTVPRERHLTKEKTRFDQVEALARFMTERPVKRLRLRVRGTQDGGTRGEREIALVLFGFFVCDAEPPLQPRAHPMSQCEQRRARGLLVRVVTCCFEPVVDPLRALRDLFVGLACGHRVVGPFPLRVLEGIGARQLRDLLLCLTPRGTADARRRR